jgi:hypothetical protein
MRKFAIAAVLAAIVGVGTPNAKLYRIQPVDALRTLALP